MFTQVLRFWNVWPFVTTDYTLRKLSVQSMIDHIGIVWRAILFMHLIIMLCKVRWLTSNQKLFLAEKQRNCRKNASFFLSWKNRVFYFCWKNDVSLFVFFFTGWTCSDVTCDRPFPVYSQEPKNVRRWKKKQMYKITLTSIFILELLNYSYVCFQKALIYLKRSVN
mgnify:CR=1 FL=1